MAPTSVSPAFDKVGYWSPITASIDWCENNYTISYYIAEFWNSTSSILIAALAAIGYMNLASYKERRMTLLMQAFFTIGVGSVLFHGTLRHKMQLLDELPMLYAATIGMFICIETHFGKQARWFPIALTAWIAITTVMFSTTSGKLQSLSFQLTYASMILSGLIFLRIFHTTRRAIRPTPPTVSRLIRLTASSMFLAITVWLIDFNLCVYVCQWSERGVGLEMEPAIPCVVAFVVGLWGYGQSVLIMYYHYEMRGIAVEVWMWKGFVPAVRIVGGGSKID